MLRFLLAAVAMGLSASTTVAQATPGVETRTVTYQDDGVTFRGYLAKPQAARGELPGVLVVHEWWGLNDYVKRRARQLAELGYVAFAADMYGGGKTTDDPKQAGQWAGALYNDRKELRDRAEAGLEVLADLPGVDEDRLAAIGYCFGGTVAIELAYEEDDLDGVVSFHGSPKPALDEDDDIEARILVLHGDDDPTVSDADLKAFTDSLDARHADYRVIRYEGAKHGFTNPAAADAGMDAVAYNREADEQSWAAMKAFLEDVFK